MPKIYAIISKKQERKFMLNKDYYELLNNGLCALRQNNNEYKKYILIEIKTICNVQDHEYAQNKMRTDYHLQGTTHINNLSTQEINQNLQAFCETLWNKIQKEQGHNYTVSFNAINFLYSNSIDSGTYILYQNNSGTLDVSKLLDTIGYGLSIAGLIFNVNTEEYENYITVLKVLERIFNNDKPQNPLKDLSYALEVFYKIQNYFETNPEKKREKKIESLSVSLFIEFLTK